MAGGGGAAAEVFSFVSLAIARRVVDIYLRSLVFFVRIENGAATSRHVQKQQKQNKELMIVPVLATKATP